MHLLPEGPDRGTEAHQILVRRSINRYVRSGIPAERAADTIWRPKRSCCSSGSKGGMRAITDPETVAAEEIQMYVLS